ncbi:Hypothetical protein CINCED_3A013923 [Cinara cedri]|uniref:Uncharacterized protein n=1 Tax=Cinara cedri TaxID=506608 RepID=A0A5E4NBC6_9HEMI|nr:Hypothetical protein CINCED_3A013923 [Cinara cedri]
MGCNPSKDGTVGDVVGNVKAAAAEKLTSLADDGKDAVGRTLFIPLRDDSGEFRDSLENTGLFSGEENSKTMKTSEETVDFEKEFRPDDVELCHAATKIQASFRGHMTRKQQAGGKDEPGNVASGTASKAENLESQLKNVDISKVI